MPKSENKLFLFDVDGTLSKSREQAPQFILDMLSSLCKKVKIAFVGGSDIQKQQEQIGNRCLDLFDFGFPENGVCFYKNGILVEQKKVIDHMGEDLYQDLVNFCLEYMSKIKLRRKRGTFIEYRNSMINICPVGRSCSKEERSEFYEYDKKEHIRINMVRALKKMFDKDEITFSIGGQISIDCFPKGWDKTYCLSHIKKERIDEIYFFGDMTHEGGNDYEIFCHPDVDGTKVSGPEDTLEKVKMKLQQLGLGEL